MILTDLQTLAHNTTLRARSVDYLVSTRKFTDAFDQASDEQKSTLQRAVMDSDAMLINTIIRTITHDCLESKNIHELREIGKLCSIYGVTKLSKSQLIILIRKEQAE